MNPSHVDTSEWWKYFAPKTLSRAWNQHRQRWIMAAVSLACLAAIAGIEMRSAPIESRLFASIDRHLRFYVQPGPASGLERPSGGPYDERLGFSSLRDFATRLKQNGYEITQQARTPQLARIFGLVGLSGIYHEKAQAGLSIEDAEGVPLFQALFPARVYPEYRAIPPLVVNTLLFIENRKLLDESHPQRNPAIEWARMGRATIDLAIHAVNRSYPIVGGSTLATQLEKMRHSPSGRTGSVTEKVRQMASASLRSYLDGIDTRPAQRRIIRDYLNSIPLAATPSQGEVLGLGDGLKAWYRADFTRVNELLSADESSLDERASQERATAYRQVLSLFLALRAPGWYLVRHPDQLKVQTDRYLRALAASGVISPQLRDRALRADLQPRPEAIKPAASFVSNKAPDAIRSTLLGLMGLDNTYALDRLDLDVKTTLNKKAQDAATQFLVGLSDPANVAAANLNQYQLLDSGNPKSVIYSVTLYEQNDGVNQLRVQTDNFDQPLDINQGTRLQLGSTAKLRTLVHYLEIVSWLHDRYSVMSPEQLKREPILQGDALTAWAVSYLSSAKDKGLEPMLEAALQRSYSGNPGEAFFTAGGLHSFANFESSENYQMFTVSSAFQHSVNLAFIRLLRDIEHYYRYRVPGASPDVLTNPDDPARARYLARFADFEGREFLKRFYEKYQGQTPDEALKTLIAGLPVVSPLRLAVIYRSVRPEDGPDKLNAFLSAHFSAQELAQKKWSGLYEKYGPDKFDLQDRGYLARVHPLELWLLNYRQHHPQASLADVYANSSNERQLVYRWLWKPNHRHGQDKRIETLLEMDSFAEIHRAWQRLGYPFDSLVPSYATAIGVSGDTPAALAKLVGIVLNDGMLYPTERIEQLHFGPGSPWETVFARRVAPGKQVLRPEIARLVRQEMLGVVQNGTGRRAHDGIKLPDGTVLPIGGKTGTGDNEFHIYAKNGGLLGTHPVNRTAAFAFFIGDRFFGTVLAFVPGKQSASYNFTSALAVQVLNDLTPAFLPVIQKAEAQHFTQPHPPLVTKAVAPAALSAPASAPSAPAAARPPSRPAAEPALSDPLQ